VINDAENWVTQVACLIAKFQVDYDLWDAEETVFDVSTNADKLTLGFGMDVHEVLVPRNLHVREGFRKLRILVSSFN
jgi:hypothetical protein